MKKTLLSLSLIAFALAGKAQNCSELFFSEYVEGSNNNKALEIYNPTSNPITINNNYRIVRYNNGTPAATAEANSQAYVVLGAHTIQPNDVWVLVIDKRDPNGVGTEIPVVSNLQAVADTFICPDYNISYAIHHNGNDALSLQKNVGGNWTYVDIIGEIGVDPVNSWSDCPPFYDGSCGAYFTKDQTLIRKSGTQQGLTSNPSPFNPTLQWDSLPNNTFTNLGTHSCNCNQVGVREYVKNSQVKMFPNPTNGSNISFVSADKRIESIVVLNTMGQEVKVVKIDNPVLNTVQNLNLSKGVYFTEIIFEDKTLTIEKLIIE